MTEQFDNPGAIGGDPINWSDVAGSLVIVRPLSVEVGIPTVHGEASAVRADVTVVDGPQSGRTYGDVLVFPKMMQAQLKTKIGRSVLGRVGRGVAKPGQTAPWILEEATAADMQTARDFGNRSTSASAPQSSAQAPF
jgi:hypothetical protein